MQHLLAPWGYPRNQCNTATVWRASLAGGSGDGQGPPVSPDDRGGGELPEHHMGRSNFRRGAMPGSKAVKERIEHLITETPELIGAEPSDQIAWLIAAQSAIHLV